MMRISALVFLFISLPVFTFLFSFPAFAGDVAEPQVQIEAKLVEVNNRTHEELGVDFQAGKEHEIGSERILELQTDVRDLHTASSSGFGDQVGVNVIPDLPARSVNPAAGPAVKLAVSPVVVPDRQTVLLGVTPEQTGIAGTEEKKAPFLGSIPVLKNLFRTNQETREKQNLVVLVTPKVISPSED